MKPEDRKLLKDKILTQIAKFESEIAQLEDATKPIGPENAIGRVSRMDAINNKSVAEAALRHARKRLYSLKTALQKVEEADFGICSRCGRQIQAARLMFLPESTHCVHCAS